MIISCRRKESNVVDLSISKRRGELEPALLRRRLGVFHHGWSAMIRRLQPAISQHAWTAIGRSV